MLTHRTHADKRGLGIQLLLLMLLGCRKEVERPDPICDPPLDLDNDRYGTVEGGGGDCNDDNKDIHPGAEDLDVDGFDQNCDGIDGPVPDCIVSGSEICDGLDNDCDGRVDDTLLVALSVGATVALLSPIGAEHQPLLVLAKTGSGETAGTLKFYDMSGELVVEIPGGDQGTSFGQQIAGGRDYNGDGFADLAVSAPYATTAAGPNHGRVFVLPGPITERSTLADAIFTFEGGELDGQAGTSLGLAPDLTGDGKAELLIGHYRHMLLFSGAVGTAVVDDAAALFELNTGGGAWHFATAPDRDGDGIPELTIGLSTYDGGKGLLMETSSGTLQNGDGTYAIPDSSWYLEGEAGAGLGDKLTRVGNHLWSLSNGIPTREDGLQLTNLSGIGLINLGDLDGDGQEDLGVETVDTLEVQTTVPQTLTGYAGFQTARDLGTLYVQDGQPELVFRTQSQSGVLDLLDTLGSTCNVDHDAASSALGDCDDTNALVTPMVGREQADGLDNDCDGEVDTKLETVISGHFLQGSGLGDGSVVLLDKDGKAVVYGRDATNLGSVTGGMASGPAQVAGTGDPDGDGSVSFLLVGDLETILYRSDLSIQTEFVDGSKYKRAAQAGNAGDVDGDGLPDPWVLLRDTNGIPTIGIWHNPSENTIADDADVLLTLPDSWTSAVVGSAPAGASADLSGDGRDDLVIGNPDASQRDPVDNAGRASVIPVISDGFRLMDTEAVTAIFGDPYEELGRSIALGDFDGDGTADAAIGGVRGARILTGLFCTEPGPYGVPTDSLALSDLDGDGVDELLGSDFLATVLGNGDAGLVWIGRFGEDPLAWRAGNSADLVGIQLFGIPGGVGVVAQEEVRLWGD